MRNSLSLNLSTFDEFIGMISHSLLITYCIVRSAAVLNILRMDASLDYLLFGISAIGYLRFVVLGLFLRRYYVSNAMRLLGIFLALCLISVLFQHALLDDARDGAGRSALAYSSAMFMAGLVWTGAGLACFRSSVRQNTLISFAIFSCLAYIVLLNLGSGYQIDYGTIWQSAGGDRVNQLSVIDYFVLALITAVALAPRKLRLIAYTCALLIILPSGSRTGFYVFLLVGGYMIWTDHRRQRLVAGLMVVVMITAFSWQLTHEVSSGQISERMAFGGDVLSDSSFFERIVVMKKSISMLPEQALIGDPGLIVKQHHSLSLYMHNVMSTWQFYGLGAFVVLCVLFSMFVRNASHFARWASLEAGFFGRLLLFYVVISALLSRHIGFYLLWFAMGYWVAALSNHKSAWRAHFRQ